jgi:tartrate-resistant acid phosphatase type 5
MKKFIVLSLFMAIILAGCSPASAALTGVAPTQPATTKPSATAEPSETLEPTETTETAEPAEEDVLFAVIGDYGQAGRHSFAVAEMIDSWDVDFITTTGDNNYPDGAAATIDENIGQYYHRYIGNYKGEYNRGSETNRFFPSLGNHDWDTEGAEPYLDYFTLPGNERYYDFVWDYIHFFVLDSDPREPEGVGVSSEQAAWLQESMADSEELWQVVVMHHPPYSSADHGSTNWIQWPFKEWGADLVLAGHDHVYERLEVDGLTYITIGLSGHASRYSFPNVLPESQFRYMEDWGALRILTTGDVMRIEFIIIDGSVIDSIEITAVPALQ